MAREPADAPAQDNPQNVVQSLAKGFRVLEAFTAAEPDLPLAQVARRASMDNATAFRLLNTLVMLGYVDATLELLAEQFARVVPRNIHKENDDGPARICDGPERPG